MGSWRSVALPGLEREEMLMSLAEEGLLWEGAMHVVATQSLAEVFLKNGDKSVTIANLIDLISLPALGPALGLKIDTYPSFPVEITKETLEEFKKARKRWSSTASYVKTKHAWIFDQFLTKYLRDNPSNDELQVLRLSRKSLRKTIQNLENSGLSPHDITPQHNLSSEALTFWRHLSEAPEYKFVSYARRDFWCYEENSGLSSRLDQALALLLGEQSDQVTIYLHGFYFYTPLQWAVFKTLKNHPKVNLVFVIHDDGKSKSLESWRRFFSVSLGLPGVEYIGKPRSDGTGNLNVFDDALSGRFVDKTRSSARVLSFENPTHLVRYLRHDNEIRIAEGRDPQLIFGAREKDLQRFTQRLSGSLVNSTVALYQLPVGMFLVSLHACIRTDASNKLTLKMSFDDFMAMIPYVIQSSSDLHLSVKQVSDFREFFSDCDSLDSWLTRASLLPANAQVIEGLGSDAIGYNALKLLPWAAYPQAESKAVEELVKLVCGLVEEIGRLHRVGLEDYAKFLRHHLEQALKSADKELHDEVISRMEMFNLGDEFQVEVSGLVEIVQKLVGRESAYDEDEDEDETRNDTIFVKPLQALDALAYSPSESDIFLANLSDRAFPSKKNIRLWPFAESEVFPASESSAFGYELLKLNEECAALGDLYLLRTAFSGTPLEHQVFITWLEESLGEKNNPSPAVAMMLEIPKATEAVYAASGGLPVTKPKILNIEAEGFSPPRLSSVAPASYQADSHTDLEISAAAFCERRFALQWFMGGSPAFQSTHLQNLLYGNMISYLVKAFRVDESRAVQICDGIWPHLPKSVRDSSIQKRAIKPASGADYRWIYTLGGSHMGRVNSETSFGRMHGAYQLLLGKTDRTRFAPNLASSTGLIPVGPIGVKTHVESLCNMCPVSKVCSRIVEEPND